MTRFLSKSTKYLLFLALVSQAACDEDSTGPYDNGVPVSLNLGLDPYYPTITAGLSGSIYTVRPNDLTTRNLDARLGDGSLVWTVVFGECTDECSHVPSVDAAGNVYLTTRQGLTSWNGASGALRWTAAGIGVGSLAVGSNSRVYGAAAARFKPDQPVYALDASTGAVIWTTIIPSGYVTEVLLDEGRSTLYALTRGQAVALDAQTGAIKFTAKNSLGVQCFAGSPGSIAADGTLYLTCDNDFLSEVSAYAPTGQSKWLRHLGSTNGTHTPLIDASGVIYVANSGSVTALTPAGEVLWKLDSVYRIAVTPVIDSDKNVYILAELKSGSGHHLLVATNGKITEDRGLVTADYYGALLLTAGGRVFYNSEGQLISFGTRGADAAAQWAQMGRDQGRTSRK